jgi:peroxiredoxin
MVHAFVSGLPYWGDNRRNYIMKVRINILALALTVVVAGCATKPISGVVGWGQSKFSVGSFAPDIPFTSNDGKQTTFHEERKPVAILAFVSPPAKECCSPSQDLLSLTKRYKVLPVEVAQVSVPTGKCPHEGSCTGFRNLGKTDLLLLCDKDRIAWNAYGQPSPGTAILIDNDSRIMQIGSIQDLSVLADKAEELANAVDDEVWGINIGD